MRSSVCFALFAASAVLVACSTPVATVTSQQLSGALADLTGQDGRACLFVRDIRGYGARSDNLLSVSTIRSSHYLLVTTYRCPALESSPAALFEGAFTELCGGGRDFVRTASERCNIRSIFEFENRDAAFEAIDAAERQISGQDQPAAVD